MVRGNVTATIIPLFPSVIQRVLWCLLVTVKGFKLAHAIAELSRRGCGQIITGGTALP